MRELIAAATEARLRAYAPYSDFLVGAALLTSSGKIYAGCNIENSSYSLTCCAERVATASAIADGHQNFEALAVVSVNGSYPCGACRQFLNEFTPDLLIIIADTHGKISAETTLSALYPSAFSPDSLEP
ncbi:cytidine deaminase [Rubritalea squalenifaciens DSM 18772]|uniref:Cytidine deaminase n=2 Tax=Rubritalea TaxID=361050 RepID=A0A1M6DY86_9BACT|nr:cytidine deaminase [Rubritalea squalenifaciens]SHI78182.1 cytidine deaminase [Rubritalea squalenifaciens DSM 18772]